MTNASMEKISGKGLELSTSIGMLTILVSFSMLFATLFLGYAVFRFSNPVWPPNGLERVDLFLPSLSTFIICLSSFSFFAYEKQSLSNVEVKNSTFWLLVTLILGIFFLISQYQLWVDMESSGLNKATGIYASINYGFTWIHAGHILIGLLLLIALFFINSSNLDSIKKLLWIKNIGKFWHFLGIIWILMFVFIFLV